MLDALEKELYIDVKEKNRNKIIRVFELAKAIQLPVVDNKKVVGILDLFVFINNMAKNSNVVELMEKDITVAGENRNVFQFKTSKQLILPFVDKNGYYLGFVNKLYQKCYLPSKEYMQVLEKSQDETIDYDADEIDYEKFQKSFNAIIESNYDGIYITVDKGKTLSINNKCIYKEGVTQENFLSDNNDIAIDGTVSVIQDIQKRNEVSVSNEVISDGGILRVINNIQDFEKLKNELRETQKLAAKYQDELEFLRWEQSKPEEVISNSLEMKKIINLINRISKVDSTVLIEGQSGVGKGVLSKLIHNSSHRKNGPFIKIDCGSIPEQLLESELFGYDRGSFTGAEKGGKVGLIELANNGTLFLDEIGELPLNLQMKLLRLIQDREIFRVGGSKAIELDIRIIAATNRDLRKMVEDKSFREDLYYRLNVVPIKIPPLKERKEDIKPLIENCLKVLGKKYNFKKQIEPTALRKLLNYDWPGNVRELNNVIENLIVTTNSDTITVEDLPNIILKPKQLEIEFVSSLEESMDLAERKLLIETMKNSKSTEEMADMLKVNRTTIARKLKKHNIKTTFRDD